jgi:titin
MQIAWDASAGASGYVIERSKNGQGGWKQVGAVDADTLTFADLGLDLGTTYYYRVQAAGLGGDSDFSEIASGQTLLLVTPGDVTATEEGASTIHIAWSSVENATDYTIERSLNEHDWATIADLDPAQTTYDDTGLSGDTKYFYRIVAHGKEGDSAAAYAGTMTFPVGAPEDLLVAATDGTSLRVSWNAVAGATGYVVERSDNGPMNWNQIATVGADATSYQDTFLAEKAVYYYRLKSLSAAGESAYSTAVGMTTAVIVSNQPLPSSPPDPAPTDPVDPPSDPVDPPADPVDPPSDPVDPPADPNPPAAPTTTTPTTPTTPVKLPPVTVPVGPFVPHPDHVTATSTISAVRVAWAGVQNAVRYQIERTTDNGTWTAVATTTGTSLTDAGLSQNTAYTYRITAIFSDGATSAASDTATAHTALWTGAGWSFWWW